nr:rod-binding protein [Rhizobium sp. RCAM05973]
MVLDVVKAADPTDVEAAQAKLAANRAAFAATSLAENGNGFGSTVDALNSAGTQAGLSNANTNAAPTKVPQVYRKFEAMMLQNFVKNMLPSSETLYGKGSAGEIWKGMMAEQLGNTIAKNGGVGIAEKMYQEQVTKMRNTGAINSATNENDKKMALSAITDFQRKTLAAADDSSDSDTSITNQNTLTSQKA